jgi:hypothetical protein
MSKAKPHKARNRRALEQIEETHLSKVAGGVRGAAAGGTYNQTFQTYGANGQPQAWTSSVGAPSAKAAQTYNQTLQTYGANGQPQTWTSSVSMTGKSKG